MRKLFVVLSLAGLVSGCETMRDLDRAEGLRRAAPRPIIIVPNGRRDVRPIRRNVVVIHQGKRFGHKQGWGKGWR